MALILLFMAIETQIWNSDGGALTSPPALLFISDEKKRWLVAESSQSNSQVLVEPGDTSLVQISPIRLPHPWSVVLRPLIPYKISVHKLYTATFIVYALIQPPVSY